ncbi:52 kDa repressor of the inhibitor of the protein kinase [Trachymyrmex cornetzi]|uniref:52 kDa repressor of the inhibitor of the protein kinase n=1 Tax=Trachymyrmex cornetzi TaxID=471704 RepID=A0A151IWX1_9HYME|nr:52 kDa repressor of the inhibitor of the protein kinase [Trachymyrmex cornetzi]
MSNRSGYKCAFKDCCSVSSGKIGLKETLFRFPKDSEKCKLWIAACNRKELYAKNPVTLHTSYRVCKKHFIDTMFLNYEKTRLQPHAVPFSAENHIGKYNIYIHNMYIYIYILYIRLIKKLLIVVMNLQFRFTFVSHILRHLIKITITSW